MAKLKETDDYVYHLLGDITNPSSVFSSVSAARENARGMREQMSSELWEALNGMYLWCRDQIKSGRPLNAAVFGARVRQGCLHLRGIMEDMMPRTKTWCFLSLGTMLERADQTSRLLDLKTCMPGEDQAEGEGFEPYVWLCIMRGVGAGSQRGFGNTEADWPRLIDTLIFNSEFPRSVRYCVREVNKVLHWLTGSAWGVYMNDAERVCGRILAELDLGAFSRVIKGDLHQYLDDLQKGFIEISRGVNRAHSHTGKDGKEFKAKPTQFQESSSGRQRQG
jgi:uncharacterized alpha-E superfamily protein